MTNSREKGARYEREVAGMLRDRGYGARRGQQYCGANGDPDVLGLPGFHIECKRVEALNIDKALEQSRHDARDGEMPLVFHRKNNTKSKVTLYAEDFLDLIEGKHLSARSSEDGDL